MLVCLPQFVDRGEGIIWSDRKNKLFENSVGFNHVFPQTFVRGVWNVFFQLLSKFNILREQINVNISSYRSV